MAQQGYEPGLQLVEGGIFGMVGVFRGHFPVPLDAYPFMGPPLDIHFLVIEGEVVLRLAGNDAGLAAGAFVKVDGHPPLVVCLLCCHRLYLSGWR